MTIDPSYMEFAKCKGSQHPNFFFAEDSRGTKEAIAFCQDCPVKTPCGEYAIENNIIYGVWGGMSIRSRKNKMRERKRLTLIEA